MSDDENSDIEVQQQERYEESEDDCKNRLYYPTTAVIKESKYRFLPEDGSLVIEDKEGKHYKTNGIDRIYWMMYGGTPENRALKMKQFQFFMHTFLLGLNMLACIFGIMVSAHVFIPAMVFFIIALIVNVTVGPIVAIKSMKSELRFKVRTTN